MFSIGFIVGAMIGGFVAIALHCMVIVGKEEDEEHEPWQLQNIGARIRETKK